MPLDSNLDLLKQLRRRISEFGAPPVTGEPGPTNGAAATAALARRLRQTLHSIGLERVRYALEDRNDELLRARELLVALGRQAGPRDTALEDFDEATYLILNPDVSEAIKDGRCGSAYDHWREWGEKEGRIARRNSGVPDLPADFDEEGYLSLNPDVAVAIQAGLYRSGYDHWKRKGVKENRQLPKPGRSVASLRRVSARESIPPDFDEDAYLLFNPDVAEAIQAGRCETGYHHWMKHGQAEHRAGGPLDRVPDRSEFLPEMERRPFGVNLYGFLSTPSGLGSVARGCVQALSSQSIPFNGIDVLPWKGGLEIRELPKFEPYRVNLIQQNADAFERFLRAYGGHLLNGSYNIGYWLWELPSARSDWHHIYQYVDEVWVTSEFCRTAFEALTPLPVKRVPPVVDGLDAKAIYGREHFGFPQDAFVFCYVFDVSSYMDRKNPFSLIEAFRREFKNSTDVLLYLKIWNSGHDEARVKELEAAVKGARNIRIYNGLFSEEEIVSLHKSVDCMVSPHRSEGFGFNLAEAMYFGKPVIATRYSSNLDFMNDDNGYLIDYKLVPIKQTAGPYARNSVWAEPSVEHLAYLLRRVFENPEERALKGARAADEIRRNYSAEAVGKIIAARFEEIGLDRPKLRTDLLKRHDLSAQRLFAPGIDPEVAAQIRAFPLKPVISIATPVYNVDAKFLRACIESVRAQWYPFWELCLSDDASTSAETREVLASYQGKDARIKIVYSDRNRGIAGASNRAVEISTGEFIALLDNDDEITPDALYEVAKAINANPAIDFIYTDEDKLEEDGSSSDHYFKPDWSPEHLQSVMYLLHMLVIRKDLFFDAGAFREEFSGAQDYDLALRATSQARAIHHIPKILYHWRKLSGSAAAVVDAKPQALDAAQRALRDFVTAGGLDASVEPGKLTGHYRVRHAIRGNPRVSLCILTHDIWSEVEGRGRINLVENFVKSISAKTDYPNYEILICDDANLSDRTKSALKDIEYRLVSYTGPVKPFNFSAKANFTFKQVKGQHLVLLNDDLQVISAEWLRALLEFSQQPEIGAVGAKLLFPGDRIQHVGVALGVNGGAAHLYHNYPADFVGYNGFTHIIRNYSAVTGACLATRKEVLERTGGFDERFAIDFNDIDFCLAALDCGYRVVYTPYAELYHFEGRSAERRTQNPQEVALFRRKWAKYIERDPYYNPNLTRDGIDFAAYAAAGSTHGGTAFF